MSRIAPPSLLARDGSVEVFVQRTRVVQRGVETENLCPPVHRRRRRGDDDDDDDDVTSTNSLSRAFV
jgi:hypothetical protein